MVRVFDLRSSKPLAERVAAGLCCTDCGPGLAVRLVGLSLYISFTSSYSSLAVTRKVKIKNAEDLMNGQSVRATAFAQSQAEGTMTSNAFII